MTSGRDRPELFKSWTYPLPSTLAADSEVVITDAMLIAGASMLNGFCHDLGSGDVEEAAEKVFRAMAALQAKK